MKAAIPVDSATFSRCYMLRNVGLQMSILRIFDFEKTAINAFKEIQIEILPIVLIFDCQFFSSAPAAVRVNFNRSMLLKL